MTTAWLVSHLGLLIWSGLIIVWMFLIPEGAQQAVGEFLGRHFDKLLLGGAIVYFGQLAMWHHGEQDSTFAQAMLDNQKLVLGALLGLITGRAIQRAADGKNGNGPPPTPPTLTPGATS
jgi:hypothetical protein